MTSRLFERGLAYVGTDYLAHILWDKYIKFEMAQHAFSNVTAVYLRALSCPLKELDRYFSRCFPSYTGSPTPKESPFPSDLMLILGSTPLFTAGKLRKPDHPCCHRPSVMEQWSWRR